MKNKENNKSFGILFFIIFSLIAIWPIFDSGSLRIWAIAISLLFLTLGIFNSKILTPLKRGWIKLGELLGKYWLIPIIIVLALFGALIVLSQGSVVAPFIYTIF